MIKPQNLKESSESDDSAKGDSLDASVGPKIVEVSVFLSFMPTQTVNCRKLLA
jgi:hypothetical protein